MNGSLGEKEVQRLFRDVDWSKSALGPMEQWPASLRVTVDLMLASAFPMFLAWGKDQIFLYNDAYAPILGEKHPKAFGRTFRENWNEIWDDLTPLIEQVERGESVYHKELRLMMHRNRLGEPEETYFTFSYSPIRDEHGTVRGLFCACVEVTDQVLSRQELKLKSDAIEYSLNGFDIVDEKGRFVYVNDAYVKMWGYDCAAEILGTSAVDHCADPSTPVEIITRLKATGACDIEFEAKRKDGSIFIVRMLAFVAHDAKGREIYPTTSIDVTAQRRATDAISMSEAHFRELVDTSPALIWITEQNSQCIYLSQRWYDFTGRTPEQDLGIGWLENIHPDDLQNTAEVYTKAVDAMGPLSVDYRLRRKDGEYIWMIDQGLPRLGKNGEFLGYIGTVTDIHDRVLAVNKLNDETERFQRSAKASDLGVWYCDLPFDVLEWNAEVKHQFFLPADARVTMDVFYERIHPDDRGPTRRAIEHSITTRSPYDIHYRTINPNDPSDFKWIRAIGWTDYDENGKAIRFDGITLNATEEYRRNEELVRARDEAERANKLKSAFLANMSHEIRTPLGALLGFSDLLRDPGLTPTEHANYLDILSRNGEQLSVIINDILDLSKVEAGHLSLEYTEMSPTKIGSEVLSLMAVKAKEKDLVLDFIAADTTPDVIISDPTRVRQVLLNLVANAIKFTQFGSVVLRSYGRTTPEGKQCICFEVSDTGIGIAPEQQDRIFEVFVQADGSMTRRFGGTGLGLALSRRLALALGGNVSVASSTLGKGSTFLFTTEHHEGKRTTELLHSLNTSLPKPELEPNSLEGLKILVVDDAPDNQRMIWHYLTKHGAMVDAAPNGLLGYRKALVGSYDLVLMDIQMPEMDGYTATQKLRNAGYLKPIIALTAHAMNEVGKKCLSVGCNDHLVKPINPVALVSAILHHTGH